MRGQSTLQMALPNKEKNSKDFISILMLLNVAEDKNDAQSMVLHSLRETS